MFRLLTSLVLTLCLTATALTATALAATAQRKLIRLDLSTAAGSEFVRLNQGVLDVVMAKPGLHADIAADARALQFLADRGHPYEVLRENLEESLAYPAKGAGFGIYHTWSENIAFVDSLRLLYPHVVSGKWSIGQSGEGRDIWAFRVSANPDVDESEPEILIDGLHHSREIMASEFPIMFAEYLARNYGLDPEITWLLDHRELYIVPVVNPDGFVFNEQTFPNGGGMWRKNRRNNGGGEYGVDLNRNYPFQWGYDNVGSSSDPSSLTYRGPAPGSEPETQAMMAFIDSREIRTHDTVHTYSNLTLYPWGYVATPTPDGAVFDHMAAQMTKYNGYTPGQPGDILYGVNGGSFDWAYGDDDGHPRFFTFSNEIGGGADGFWPAESRRQQLFQENVWPHIYLMQVAGTWATVHSPVIILPAKAGAKSVNPGQSAALSFTLENPSVYASLIGLDLTVTTDDPWLQLDSATRSVGSLPSLGSLNFSADPLPFSVDAGCPDGHQATVTVVLHLADGDLAYPLTFTVGTPAAVVTENFEKGTTAWTLEGSWGLTSSTSHTPTRSLTDSPAGNYLNESFTAATLIMPRRVTGLQFWHRYDLESTYDFGRVQVGTADNWQTLASYTGTQTAWQLVSLDLEAFAGQDVQIRFVVETDQSVLADGWYIDDVVLLGDPTGQLPAAPAAISPLAGATLDGDGGSLVVGNSVDPLGGNLVYGFRVYSDAACTQLVAAADNVAEGGGQTAWPLPVVLTGTHYWRAWAGGIGRRSNLSPAEPFNAVLPTGVGGVVVGRTGLRVLDGVTGGQSRLELSLAGGQDVRLEIFDARGARVRRLHSGAMAGGTRTLVWDGRDSQGRSAASGVYFVRLSAGRVTDTGRVVIVR